MTYNDSLIQDLIEFFYINRLNKFNAIIKSFNKIADYIHLLWVQKGPLKFFSICYIAAICCCCFPHYCTQSSTR